MQSVFVAGSITIKKLPDKFVERFDNLISAELNIMVGDANGADSAMQQILLDRGSQSVTVFCSGDQPRNNLGHWPVRSIRTPAKPGTRQFFSAKDLAMAATADFGLMLWDSKSTGTLSNVIELTKRRKKSVVYVHRHHAFSIVHDVESLQHLVDLMSDDALSTAETKIGLSDRIRSLSKELQGFPF
jgi:hypothetical protein